MQNVFSTNIDSTLIADIQGSFSDGQICPIFTITLVPEIVGLVGDNWDAAIAQYLPSPVSITMLGQTWTCEWRTSYSTVKFCTWQRGIVQVTDTPA